MCEYCDSVSWDDYFKAVAAIIEGGGPLAEIVKRKVEEDFEEGMRFLKIMDKREKGEYKTVRFTRYSSLPLAD